MKKVFVISVAFLMVLSACKSKSESKNEGLSGKSSEIKVKPDV